MFAGNLKILALGVIFATTISVYSAPIALDLNGNHVWAGWSGLTGAAYPGYPSTVAPWPSPITSNLGTDSAGLNKVSGIAYPASTSIYSLGFSETPNLAGATLSVSDSNLIANLKTIVFQLEIGEAFGYDLLNHAAPILLINGSASSLQPNFTSLFGQVQNGTFPVPGGGEAPIYVNTWGFQWDLSTYVGSITSLQIQFTTVQHSQIYAMQLDQTDAVYTAAVPEPSTYLLMGMAAVTLLILRKKRGALRSS